MWSEVKISWKCNTRKDWRALVKVEIIPPLLDNYEQSRGNACSLNSLNTDLRSEMAEKFLVYPAEPISHLTGAARLQLQSCDLDLGLGNANFLYTCFSSHRGQIYTDRISLPPMSNSFTVEDSRDHQIWSLLIQFWCKWMEFAYRNGQRQNRWTS